MTEAVAPIKPRSTRVVIASLLVFVLLAAFGAAFYYLDGTTTLNGLVDGILAATTGPPSLSPRPVSAEPTGTRAPAGVLRLPAGVDEAFAKRMYLEQAESQTNIGKLVTGKVDEFGFGSVAVSGDRAVVDLSVTFGDGTSAPGKMVFARKGGKWYLESLSGGRDAKTGGDADSVSTGVDEDDPAHVREAAQAKVDVDVLNTMLEQHAAHQDLIAGIVARKLSGLTIDAVDPGAGTATLAVSLKGTGNAAAKGRILCVSKSIDGVKMWFVVSFEEV